LSKSRVLFGEKHLSEQYAGVARGTVQAFSMRGPDKEPSAVNEDCAAVIPLDDSTAVFAVADGFGGCRGGDQASQLAIKEVKRAVSSVSPGGDSLRSAILDAFEAANESVLGLGIGAASTLVVVEVQNGCVRPYHVGDSLTVLVGNRGKVKMQTVAHSPVGYAVESGVLDEEEAMQHDERHLVSNMIGSHDMHIQIGSAVKLDPRDTLLLASDGLFDNMHSGEILENIRKGKLNTASRKLAEKTLERMVSGTGDEPSKPDDFTFLLYRQSAELSAGRQKGHISQRRQTGNSDD
jgi:serine/threonine protein phosphatase PrpC